MLCAKASYGVSWRVQYRYDFKTYILMLCSLYTSGDPSLENTLIYFSTYIM